VIDEISRRVFVYGNEISYGIRKSFFVPRKRVSRKTIVRKIRNALRGHKRSRLSRLTNMFADSGDASKPSTYLTFSSSVRMVSAVSLQPRCRTTGARCHAVHMGPPRYSKRRTRHGLEHEKTNGDVAVIGLFGVVVTERGVRTWSPRARPPERE